MRANKRAIVTGIGSPEFGEASRRQRDVNVSSIFSALVLVRSDRPCAPFSTATEV